MIQLWIGSNNLDWVFDVRTYRTIAPEGYDVLNDPDALAARHLAELPSLFTAQYRAQLERLVARAEGQHYPVAIVVFGLPDLASYFHGLDKAIEIHRAEPRRFPKIDTVYEHFESFRPPFREKTIEVRNQTDRALRALVMEMASQLSMKGSSRKHVRLYYSDIPSYRIDFSDVSLLGPVDGFHPSVKLHNQMGALAAKEAQDFFPFLFGREVGSR